MGERPPGRRSRSTPAVALPTYEANSSIQDGDESRVVAVWCEWLDALATDAEAALAAAMAYKALDDSARDRWLNALELDADRVRVPPIALYAPLLAVESDPERRARITARIGPMDADSVPQSDGRALVGLGCDGTRIATIVSPLYLDFVQVLACGYRLNEGFSWVRHDPIVKSAAAPQSGDELSGVVLESTPLRNAVDELALVVLAHSRSGRELPEALKIFADLFDPVVSSPSGAD